MKKFSMLMLLAVGIAAGSFAWAEHHEGDHKHTGWFDSANCDVCKPWDANPELMTAVKWETHLLKNGMLMTASVPKEHMKAYESTCSECKQIGAEAAASGKQLSMCGFCEAMGGLMAAGLEMEEIKTDFGMISIMTSKDPEVVKKIHEVAKKTQEETKKMMAMMEK